MNNSQVDLIFSLSAEELNTVLAKIDNRDLELLYLMSNNEQRNKFNSALSENAIKLLKEFSVNAPINDENSKAAATSSLLAEILKIKPIN